MISRAQKIAIAGVVSPAGLGDALQYYVAVRLLNNLLPEADITFICPDLKQKISVFRNLKLPARLLSAGLTGSGLLRYLLHSHAIDQLIDQKYTSITDRKTTAEAQVDIVNTFLEIIRIIGEKCCDSYAFGKYIGSSIGRSLFSFNAGIFGGHTICSNLYHFIVQYEILRSAVRGPMLTSPISISRLALEHYGHKTLLKRLKQSLQKLDFIYVRGPNSLEILRNHLSIGDERVAMALDSGFGMRLFHPDIIASKVLGKQALRILIIPRKEYFDVHNRWDLYKSYLDALVCFILWLSRSFDAEVYLASQTVDHGRIGDPSGIGDVVKLLEKSARSNSRCLKCLKVVKPNNIIDAYRLYGSADLVISSYMHGGIMALSAGVPTVFINPSADVKVLDILSFLGLDTNCFLIDMFDLNALKAENFINRIGNIIENLESYRKIVEFAVNRVLPTVELPVRKLTKLLG